MLKTIFNFNKRP